VQISQLKSISAYIGILPNLVQGPGGNTSIKIGSTLFVKASGTRLVDALSQDIFCQLDLNTGEVLTPELRPSIELGLHREIEMRVVIHVHSIGSLAWALRERTPREDDFLDQLKIHRAPYLRPGDSITRYLSQVDRIESYDGVLLQNHGLIIWADTCRDALYKLLRVESELYMAGSLSVSPKKPTHNLSSIPTGTSLTPDHAVFSDDADISTSETNREVLWALEEALRLIPLSSGITSIGKEEVEQLRDWEAEKFRKKMNR
jgi:rhamnose utilization protein RhaD (predicted bifunctional aldolase and dehydrogenase)